MVFFLLVTSVEQRKDPEFLDGIKPLVSTQTLLLDRESEVLRFDSENGTFSLVSRS